MLDKTCNQFLIHFFAISQRYHLKWLSSYVIHISDYVLTLKETMSCPLFRVGKILTARDFPCGKSRDFPGWELPSKFVKLGNTGKYFIKKIYNIFFFCKKNVFKLNSFYYVAVPFKICYKMNCNGILYKMKMKAASL